MADDRADDLRLLYTDSHERDAARIERFVETQMRTNGQEVSLLRGPRQWNRDGVLALGKDARGEARRPRRTGRGQLVVYTLRWLVRLTKYVSLAVAVLVMRAQV